MGCEIVKLSDSTPPLTDLLATWCNTHRRREIECLRQTLESANQLNADMNKQRQEMIRRAYDAELQLSAIHDIVDDLSCAHEFGKKCLTCDIKAAFSEKRFCSKCGIEVQNTAHVYACDGKRVDLPECVSCKLMGKLCGYHEPKKRKDVLPGMEDAMAQRAHQTAQEAQNPKPKPCNHPPLGVCKNCDLI